MSRSLDVIHSAESPANGSSSSFAPLEPVGPRDTSPSIPADMPVIRAHEDPSNPTGPGSSPSSPAPYSPTSPRTQETGGRAQPLPEVVVTAAADRGGPPWKILAAIAAVTLVILAVLAWRRG